MLGYLGNLSTKIPQTKSGSALKQNKSHFFGSNHTHKNTQTSAHPLTSKLLSKTICSGCEGQEA